MSYQPESRIFLNLKNPLNFAEAARRVAIEKKVIAVNFHTFGLLGCASTLEETMLISHPKGHHGIKPHTLIINHINDIIPIIDHDRLHPKLSSIINDPDEFYRRIASQSHIRFPIKPNAKIYNLPFHQGIMSYENNNPDLPLAQCIMFKGLFQDFISHLYSLGLNLGAVTSMNFKSFPTITHVKDALSFIETTQVDTFIYQPNVKVLPSYSGIELTRTGIKLVREGNISADTLANIWSDVPFYR